MAEGPFDESINTAKLLGLKKEREKRTEELKPSTQTLMPIANIGEPLYLPNYSGIKEGAKKGSSTEFIQTDNSNFTTLTNDSMADALHRHSELSASDGTPNPALQVDADGNVGIGTASPIATLDVNGNTTIRGQLNITGASRIKVNRATAQTIAASTLTIVQYNVEEFDNLGEYDSATNYRFTATQAGYYYVDARILFNQYTWLVDTSIDLYVYKNGANAVVLDTDRIGVSETAITYHRVGGSTILYLAANDYIDIRIWQVSAASRDLYASNIYNNFAVHRLS